MPRTPRTREKIDEDMEVARNEGLTGWLDELRFEILLDIREAVMEKPVEIHTGQTHEHVFLMDSSISRRCDICGHREFINQDK